MAPGVREMRLLFAVAVLMLAACAGTVRTPEQQAARDAATKAEAEATVGAALAECRALGYVERSPEMMACARQKAYEAARVSHPRPSPAETLRYPRNIDCTPTPGVPGGVSCTQY